MEIKLVAVDLDDTLLNSRQEIGEECYKAVEELKSKGVIVVLATGRMFRAALPYAEKLGLDMPLIAYQGALVKKPGSNRVLYCQNLENEMALEVMRFLDEADVYYHIYADDNLYVDKITREVDFYIESGIEPLPVGKLIFFADNRNITEIMASVHDEKRLLKIAAGLRENFGDKLHISYLKNRYIEIMHKKANKGEALKFICNYYGINREEVMAIGDGYNDIPMLKWAGVGVAMENAPKEVKKAADFITFSSDENGVAYALKKFILKD
ncbi:Cof-type HAD-IIB family hydrolase [Thermosyntropha sp.]|uniref:Cof-type HAD-IIB family hydrolase n=1 Tax=Thermosyntropha sp. TaxID=2740820 RepID=UPI0026000BBA|nr:Cof-type HAD-IIB family hydrolase [Thermosyntropha sp.]MBO8159009.1 HAD family phosphatase [Thermosyntropha sp.]